VNLNERGIEGYDDNKKLFLGKERALGRSDSEREG